MKVAVCDDEKIFLNQMEEELKNFIGMEQIDCYDDVQQLNKHLETHPEYDIIFMDIEWRKGDENGTHYASGINELYPDVQIIFVTAYNDRFSESIFWEPVNLCGYLTKPVKHENIRILLEKAKRNIKRRQNEQMVVSYQGITETLSFSDILYLESNGHQILIHTTKKRIAVYRKLDDYEKLLSGTFVRTHKSFLVNMNYIRRMEHSELTLQNNTVLPVSKSKYQAAKNQFFRFMGERL